MCRSPLLSIHGATQIRTTRAGSSTGIGCDSAEAPFIGTDLGPAADEAVVLRPGMVFVLEPIAWEDGTGGYRGEEIVVVTEGGWMPLTEYPYDPYEVTRGN